ncbi:hypothetical protein Tco_1453748 [Tanacetum coccineum]
MHDKKLDLSYLHIFGSLCYPTNDNEDLGKLKAKADIGIFVGYAPAKKDFRIYNKRTRLMRKQFISGLVPNSISQTPYVSPTKNDWDLLFQSMFDEYLNPPSSVVSLVQAVAALRPVDLAGSPSSTSINKDEPSASISSTQAQKQSLIISQGVKESPQPSLYYDPCHEILHEASTSQGSSSNM